MDSEKVNCEKLEVASDDGARGLADEWTEDPRMPAIRRKVDLRLCLILACLYVINQIDRSNLGVAMVSGMKEGLHISGYQYSIIVLAFFPTYVVLQPVSTVLCRKIGPRFFITGLVVGWGAVVTGMAFVKSWKSLVVTRVLLGLIEAGFFPSALFLLSMWYVRREVAKRNAVMYLTGNVASGFGGILAYGVSLWIHNQLTNC
jgi:MFS family permease